jgi:hypothetical protein
VLTVVKFSKVSEGYFSRVRLWTTSLKELDTISFEWSNIISEETHNWNAYEKFVVSDAFPPGNKGASGTIVVGGEVGGLVATGVVCGVDV